MFWSNLRSNIIKWWRIIYVPIVKKIFATREEQEAYYKEELQEDFAKDEAETDEKHKEIDPSLLHNKKYNATTNSMSGEYGTKKMDESTKEQLDSILQNNYSTTNLVDSLLEKEAARSTPEKPELTAEEKAAKEEEIRRANEIYERLLQEAREDELKRKEEIAAAMRAAENK